MHTIHTPQLVLRQLQETAADADFILELLNTPDWVRYIGDRGVRQPADAIAYIKERINRAFEHHGFGMWLVCRRTDGQALGICGLVQRDFLPSPDIGFGFLPQFYGKGYAREAAQAVMQWAYDTLSLERLFAIVLPNNAPSIGLLLHLGFVYERVIEPPDEGDSLEVYVHQGRH